MNMHGLAPPQVPPHVDGTATPVLHATSLLQSRRTSSWCNFRTTLANRIRAKNNSPPPTPERSCVDADSHDPSTSRKQTSRPCEVHA